ncbi:MAG: hypothetical protein KatS3mg077_2904 [Candidatus Binatia bacterium]|nr:MAG: hypothetical protein KatS3mg077_2904 [Candidatus Binatia bacterium]
MAGLASGAYGAVDAGRNGMYASAAVGALLLAAGAHRLVSGNKAGTAKAGSVAGQQFADSREGVVLNDASGGVDAVAADTRAQAVYGETASLRPQPNDLASAADLRTAREWVADVSERNTNVRFALPNPHNQVEMRVWDEAVRASQVAQRWNLPADVRHFFMRQEGIGPQQPWWAAGQAPYGTFGPFVAPTGGAIPAGNRAYIDFYRGIR